MAYIKSRKHGAPASALSLAALVALPVAAQTPEPPKPADAPKDSSTRHATAPPPVRK